MNREYDRRQEQRVAEQRAEQRCQEQHAEERRAWKREEIAFLFRSGTPAELCEFIQSCPDFPQKEEAVSVVRSASAIARELALRYVSQGLAYGRDPGLGAEVALAAHDLLREAFTKYGSKVIPPMTVSGAAAEAVQALNLVGRYTEAVRFAESIEPYEDESKNGSIIRVGRINALIELNRIDDAKAAIAEERRRGVSEEVVLELNRHAAHLDRITQDPRTLDDRGPASTASEDLARRQRELMSMADDLQAFLTGSGADFSQWQATKMIRDATAIFTDPAKERDPCCLEQSLDALTKAQDWCRQNKATSQENDALWGMALCLSRLEKPAAAADALQHLRANVEAARAGVSDPLQRGGFSRTYPHLFESLCRMLMKADKPVELLNAIEGAKGRAIADLLAQRLGRRIDERELSRSTAALPGLMKVNRAHYLSFLIDDKETYAVLVGKDGTVHGSGFLPIGRTAVQEISAVIDPIEWGINKVDPFGLPVENADRTLSPLLDWLAPHVASGLIQDGDHICYSADEYLNYVPLHFVHFQGRPLVDRFSVSRSHGAYSLVLTLTRPPTKSPTDFIGLEVPLRTELRKAKFLDELHRPLAWLESALSGRCLVREEATNDALRQLDLRGRIIHFATHGIFPNEEWPGDPNPYLSSGLLLAGTDGLPDDDLVSRGQVTSGMLTPERVFGLGLDFSGSHITLQACVTGLAKEGLGGDALGLDWAFVQSGAESLLVTHWDVDVASSSEYCTLFYKYWIMEKCSRAVAWRKATRDLMHAGGKLSKPNAWAAFSLCGDWR